MFKLTKVALALSVMIFLAGCDTSQTSDTTSPSDTNQTEALIGGTADHPKELQFDKAYLVTPDLGKTYVKVNVDKYQRIVIERVADRECKSAGGGSFSYFSTLYDSTLQYKPLYAFGITQDVGNYNQNGVHDLIFLNNGVYVFEYSFPTMNYRYTNCSKALLTARNMGVSSLKKIVNKGKYSYRNFYFLEMKNDGFVNLKKGDYSTTAILYDEDLNIIENIDLDSNTPDINVSLSQGNYLLRQMDGEITITFNP